MQASSNRLTLKRLRNRAGLTAKQASQAIGLRESGYMRYEDDKRFDGEAIPATIIMGLLPLMVGKGDPPVRQEELLSISELANIREVLGAGAFKPVATAVREASEFVPTLHQVPIKHQIEAGTYREIGRLKSASYGSAPILPLRSYAQDAQWCAIINDDSADDLGLPKGTILHCIDGSVLGPEAMPPGSVVVVTVEKGELVAVVAATVIRAGRNPAVRIGGKEVTLEDATILGVAAYRYGPVQSRNV